VMTVLFFGGWHSPVIPGLGALDIPFAGEFLGSFIWFMLKTTFWLAVFIWFRGTFPRFRVDQMMDYAWKALLPIAMLNIVITSYLQYSDWHFRIWQFNNWYIYNGYIKPLFASDLTSTYGIPIITLVSILLATDIIGAVSKTRTQEWRRILIFIAIVAAALAVLNYMKVYHLI
ncbi:MAG TPA: NADH-quinone oxidoreductase subunit H, partial [bacterium]